MKKNSNNKKYQIEIKYTFFPFFLLLYLSQSIKWSCNVVFSIHQRKYAIQYAQWPDCGRRLSPSCVCVCVRETARANGARPVEVITFFQQHQFYIFFFRLKIMWCALEIHTSIASMPQCGAVHYI